MGFKRAFMSDDGQSDASIEAMFALLVELQAQHALIVEQLSDVQAVWPFKGCCGRALMEHLPRVLSLSRKYLVAYGLGMESAELAMNKRNASRVRAVLRDQALSSGVALDDVLQSPFLYFAKQVPHLKTLVLHSQNVEDDFPQLMDALSHFQAASHDLVESMGRLQNRAQLRQVDMALPGVRDLPEVEQHNVFRHGKSMVLRGEAKLERGQPYASLFLFPDLMLLGYRPTEMPRTLLRMKRDSNVSHMRDAVPLAEARMTVKSARELTLERVGHFSVQLHFRSPDLCAEWTTALTREIAAAKNRVFGVALDAIHLRDGTAIPWVVSFACETLARSSWDIFQLLLARVESGKVFALRDKCNTENPKLDAADRDPGMLMVLLLMFLRSLPEPLIPFESCNQFLLHRADPHLLRVAIGNVRAESRVVLELLVRTLAACCQRAPPDTCDAGLVLCAKTFGHVVLRHRQDHDASALMWIVDSFGALSDVFWTLLKHCDVIFPRAGSGGSNREFLQLSTRGGSNAARMSHHPLAGSVSPRGEGGAWGGQTRGKAFSVGSIDDGSPATTAAALSRLGQSSASGLTVGARHPALLRPRGGGVLRSSRGHMTDDEDEDSVVVVAKPSESDSDDDDEDVDDIIIVQRSESPPPLPAAVASLSPRGLTSPRVLSTTLATDVDPSFKGWLQWHRLPGTEPERCWVVLGAGRLQVFADPTAVSRGALLALDLASCRLLPSTAGQAPPMCFRIQVPEGVVVVLSATKQQDFVAWMTLLNHVWRKKSAG